MEVITDDLAGYQGMVDFEHRSVRHSAGGHVKEQAHIKGIESFWAALKRESKGVFHQISCKRLDRYVHEFARKHNVRTLDNEEDSYE